MLKSDLQKDYPDIFLKEPIDWELPENAFLKPMEDDLNRWGKKSRALLKAAWDVKPDKDGEETDLHQLAFDHYKFLNRREEYMQGRFDGIHRLAWLALWRAADFSWAGLKRKEAANRPGFRNLAEVFAIFWGEGMDETALKKNGRLVEFPMGSGHWWTLAHFPLFDEDGEPTPKHPHFKDDSVHTRCWEDNELSGQCDAELFKRMQRGGRARHNSDGKLKGEDKRAWLDGVHWSRPMTPEGHGPHHISCAYGFHLKAPEWQARVFGKGFCCSLSWFQDGPILEDPSTQNPPNGMNQKWLSKHVARMPTTQTSVFFDSLFSSDYCRFGLNVSFATAYWNNRSSLKGVRFGDQASFQFACWGDHASLSDSRWGAYSDFARCTFGESAQLTSARWGVSAKFESAMWGERANFKKSNWASSPTFVDAQWGNSCQFGGANWDDSANFRNAKWGQGASFRGAKWGDDSEFVGATWNYGACFGGARWGARASFEFARWVSSPRFEHSHWGDGANFQNADFGDDTQFRHTFGIECTFEGAVDFSFQEPGQSDTDGKPPEDASPNFKSITFDGVIFKGDVNFNNRVFTDKTSFENCRFEELVKFHNATLHQDTNFRGAQFDVPSLAARRIDFEAEKRDDEALKTQQREEPKAGNDNTICRFISAHFMMSVALSAAVISILVWFMFPPAWIIVASSLAVSIAVFRVAKRFSAISRGVRRLYRWRWRWRRQGRPMPDDEAINQTDNRMHEYERAFRTLKLAMEGVRSKNEEQMFYRLELLARRQRLSGVPAWEKAVSFLYELFADYGRSISRPIVCLFFVVLLFAGVFHFWDAADRAACADTIGARQCGPAPAMTVSHWTFLDPYDEALFFSMRNVFRPFGVWTSDYAAVLSDEAQDPNWQWMNTFISRSPWNKITVRLVASFQSLLAIVLLFLLLLSLRRRFQIT